jgi:hypothetical protein
VITADGSGVVSGYLQYDNGPPLEPFPQASDPDAGYPPGLSLSEVDALRYSSAGVRYPLRDARYQDGVLTFLWSPNDLFQGWCALQTPQRWNIAGRTFYFCGPQDAGQLAALDPVKRSLCVSASLGSWCPEPDGTELPCPCVGPDPAQCSVAVCHCDSQGCEADTRSLASKAELVVNGDTMTGGWESSTNTVASYSYLPMVRGVQ